MAIGLGRMFGFRFPENFRWPYVAQSIQDFWRRWHISLSTWFRDYLYIPLGGNQATPARTYVNLVIVFALCGLWHGASWNFLVWGLFHGVFLVVERLGLARVITQGWRPLRHAYTLLVVMIGWVFFRADTLTYALAFLSAMAGAAPSAPTLYTPAWYLTPAVWIALVAGAIGSMPLVPALNTWRARFTDPSRRWLIDAAATAAVLLLLAASVLEMAARSYNPFIYFRF